MMESTETAATESTEHVLDLIGTGFFSRGRCLGCEWAMKGAASDIERAFPKHFDGMVTLPLPTRVVVPPPTEDPYLDLLEQRIIELLTHRLDFAKPTALHTAYGLAEARYFYISQHPEFAQMTQPQPEAFVALLMGRIATLSKHRREKLRHPLRTRSDQQTILES
jgi:hypothetical protein